LPPHRIQIDNPQLVEQCGFMAILPNALASELPLLTFSTHCQFARLVPGELRLHLLNQILLI
jgi:hypothetical protein